MTPSGEVAWQREFFKTVAAPLVVHQVPHAEAVLLVVPVDGSPEVDAGLLPGMVGGEDGTGLDAVGTLDETGETAAVGDFVVVDEESEVGVVHGGGFGRVGGCGLGIGLQGTCGGGGEPSGVAGGVGGFEACHYWLQNHSTALGWLMAAGVRRGGPGVRFRSAEVEADQVCPTIDRDCTE